MTSPTLRRQLLEKMAKHLPPSGNRLRLVDVGGQANDVLSELRPDLDVVLSPGQNDEWQVKPNSIDAIVAYECEPHPTLLESSLVALRPGGRLIIIRSIGEPSETLVKTLETTGYTRILVEFGLEFPSLAGVLMRGEKPHTEAHTVDRIKQTASQDAPRRPGRYVHLLIRQSPNKPAWKLKPNEKIHWQAVAVQGDNETVLLAFSSLPKAVEFMQPAVMAGHIKDVNKIAKFRWEVVQQWPCPLILNPSDEIFDTQALHYLTVDAHIAEAPDE